MNWLMDEESGRDARAPQELLVLRVLQVRCQRSRRRDASNPEKMASAAGKDASCQDLKSLS